MILLRETPTPVHLHEEDIARCWWALPPGILLLLNNGHTYQLVFAGRPGGALGPDVRDAVFHPDCVGDIEFHIRASDWFTHLHHRDARYNNVILHVVLILDDPTPTLRQDGAIIPTCSLQDVSPLPHTSHPAHTTNLATTWPCQTVIQEMCTAERTRLLKHAGLLRFEQKTHTFVELLHNSHAHAPFDTYDTCLIPALAEGFGYGRDRAFFRAAGSYLLGLAVADAAPEPLGRTPDPPPLDAQRLHTLRSLVEQWRTSGAWQTLRQAITAGFQGAQPFGGAWGVPTSSFFPLSTENHRVIQALRAVFGGLSTARSDILICNIVLPFASAVALLEHDHILFEQAQTLYEQYPGLSSNQITRAMCRQLLLHDQPGGACQQQGLHYIYQQTCREKRCDMCIIGRQTL